MPARRGQIYCQRCLAPNPVERDLCGQCGTRLMLVVEPAAHRYEDDAVGGGYEEHLLERVTVLEHHLTRFAEKLEKTLDLLLRQARSSSVASGVRIGGRVCCTIVPVRFTLRQLRSSRQSVEFPLYSGL